MIFSLAIIVMVILISCNDLLKSRCYFIGLPWSKSKLYYIHETVEEEVQLLLVREINKIFEVMQYKETLICIIFFALQGTQ